MIAFWNGRSVYVRPYTLNLRVPHDQVVRALRQCCLGDSVGFLDEARFESLLPALVAQLAGAPPDNITPALAAIAAADPPPPPGARLDDGDTFGAAVVGALAEMAVAARSDVLWKPLNHAVRCAMFFEPRCRGQISGTVCLTLCKCDLFTTGVILAARCLPETPLMWCTLCQANATRLRPRLCALLMTMPAGADADTKQRRTGAAARDRGAGRRRGPSGRGLPADASRGAAVPGGAAGGPGPAGTGKPSLAAFCEPPTFRPWLCSFRCFWFVMWRGY